MTSTIASELQELVSIYENFLPKSDVDSIKELVSVNEYAVAFENFCTQLFEYDVVVSQADKHRFEVLGTEMRVDPSLWLDL